jgi:hypothetical protein
MNMRAACVHCSIWVILFGHAIEKPAGMDLASGEAVVGTILAAELSRRMCLIDGAMFSVSKSLRKTGLRRRPVSAQGIYAPMGLDKKNGRHHPFHSALAPRWGSRRSDAPPILAETLGNAPGMHELGLGAVCRGNSRGRRGTEEQAPGRLFNETAIQIIHRRHSAGLNKTRFSSIMKGTCSGRA